MTVAPKGAKFSDFSSPIEYETINVLFHTHILSLALIHWYYIGVLEVYHSPYKMPGGMLKTDLLCITEIKQKGRNETVRNYSEGTWEDLIIAVGKVSYLVKYCFFFVHLPATFGRRMMIVEEAGIAVVALMVTLLVKKYD